MLLMRIDLPALESLALRHSAVALLILLIMESKWAIDNFLGEMRTPKLVKGVLPILKFKMQLILEETRLLNQLGT